MLENCNLGLNFSRLRASKSRAQLDIKVATRDRLKVTRDTYGFKSIDAMLIAFDDAFRASAKIGVIQQKIAVSGESSVDFILTEPDFELAKKKVEYA